MLSFKETSQKCVRRNRGWTPFVCLFGFLLFGLGPQATAVPQAGQTPANQTPGAQTPATQTPSAQTPASPPTTDQAPQTIEAIELEGNRRIPRDTIMSRVYTRVGDVYDEAALQRDLRSVWNTGYFDDVRIEREQTAKGWTIHIYVREKPTIRTIEYHGLNSVSVSDVLDRYKKLKVPLTVDSPYDPTKVTKARVVLQQLLAEHGRQFATIAVQVQPIPPSSVAVTFNIKEGPKVKVGKIIFQGNKHVSNRHLLEAMKNLHPIGIPNSIFLESLFAKTFDASKLEEDSERVRDALQHYGYFKANVDNPKTNLRTIQGGFHVPLFEKRPAKVMDITVPIEEGERYRLKGITFKNNQAIKDTSKLRLAFPIKDGDIFDTHLLEKGIQNLRKAYGTIGYINFSDVPSFDIDDAKKLITVNIEVDEGKPYFVRRIEFQGNTTTRDKVIRRQLLVQEGQVYNQQLWDLSVLRLNQLQYFDALKPEEDTERKLNEQEGTVDLTVKVREKGKNSIGLTGGVSGLEGSFIGLNYQTNNFLGLGETLEVQANVGSISRVLLFGFTEPYVFDRPLAVGFTVYNRKYDFNQARQAAIAAGQPVNLPTAVLNQLLNYNQTSTGVTGSMNYTLPRSFKRLGLTYTLDRTSITTFTPASTNLFETLQFRSISGPDALSGIITSSLSPSFSFSTLNPNPLRPHSGHSFFASAEVAGLGGNVDFYRPLVSFTQFIPIPKQGGNTLGMRFQASFINGFNGNSAPPYQRFYMGGETDLRGFDTRTVSPYVFVPTVMEFPLRNPDNSFVPIDPTNPRRGNVMVPIPVNNITLPGGDTSLFSNFEYRIKIVGPVVLAPFMDLGMDFVSLDSQLKVAPSSVTQLNSTVFGCPSIVNFQCAGGNLLPFSSALPVVPGTNFVPRMSTGLELQVLLPIVQQPFRIYYAYNPLTLNTIVTSPSPIVRSMFPPGGAGDFSFQQAINQFGPNFHLQEPKHTFRFTISTTF
ncbi:MAG TPA: outer membrane protein assembly factor BamA [Candidatus Angelobacter sp.]